MKGDLLAKIKSDNNLPYEDITSIMLEEATQFTEFQFQTLTESNRSSGLCKKNFKPRMYFTCNPGGVGHMWFKRLFIDKDYRNSEKAEDYVFIQSLVYENPSMFSNKALVDESKKFICFSSLSLFTKLIKFMFALLKMPSFNCFLLSAILSIV